MLRQWLFSVVSVTIKLMDFLAQFTLLYCIVRACEGLGGGGGEYNIQKAEGAAVQINEIEHHAR
jgi:hypothetical protein